MAGLSRLTAASVLGLLPCLLIGGCLSHAPQRSMLREPRADGLPNRRLVVRPERRLTEAQRDKKRRAAQPWLSQW